MLPARSLAVQVTLVTPTGNVDPERGTQVSELRPLAGFENAWKLKRHDCARPARLLNHDVGVAQRVRAPSNRC